MISAAAWIARGKAARNPTKYNVEDEAELERVAKLTNVHFDDAKEQLAKAQKAAANWNREGQQQDEAGDGWEDDDNDDDDEDIKDDEKTAEAAAGAGQEVVADDATMDTDDANDLAKYNLDSYDNDAEEESAGQLGAFSNIKGLQFYRNNDEDPYITMKEEDEDEDREELEVLPTDNLIVCAKTETRCRSSRLMSTLPKTRISTCTTILCFPAFPCASSGSTTSRPATGQTRTAHQGQRETSLRWARWIRRSRSGAWMSLRGCSLMRF
ncbi:hypothetical protein L7F22_010072 [Adiantum nelumboides]|nr:hypothetical protein [Adiantum nelumboides]